MHLEQADVLGVRRDLQLGPDLAAAQAPAEEGRDEPDAGLPRVHGHGAAVSVPGERRRGDRVGANLLGRLEDPVLRVRDVEVRPLPEPRPGLLAPERGAHVERVLAGVRVDRLRLQQASVARRDPEQRSGEQRADDGGPAPLGQVQHLPLLPVERA